MVIEASVLWKRVICIYVNMYMFVQTCPTMGADSQESQMRMSDFLELELQMVVGHYTDGRNWTLVIGKSKRHFLIVEPSPQLLIWIILMNESKENRSHMSMRHAGAPATQAAVSYNLHRAEGAPFCWFSPILSPDDTGR